MTMMLLAGGAVLLLIVVFAFTRKAAPAIEFADDEVYWDDDEDELAEEAHNENTRSIRFPPGFMYTWEQIEDLLWAYGYSHDEVQAAYNYNYISICRDGLRAEFDGSLSATDKAGNQLYACHQFDPDADTSDSDRWRRQPTDDERRRAVWR